MIIDCDTCAMRDTDVCADCVVTAVLEPERGPLIFDGDEVVAITLLQDAGLLPATRYEPDDDVFEMLGQAADSAAQYGPVGRLEDRERTAAGGLHG